MLCDYLFMFQQAESHSIYGAEIDEWVKAWNMYSRNKDALDLLVQKIEGVRKFTVRWLS